MNKVKINKISAVIHHPDSKSDKLVILLPGYLDSKDYLHLVALAEDLKTEGYTVVRFDPTGTWESGGDISDYTIAQQLEDIKNILEYMLGKNNYRYIVLGGHSRGGFVSILYATGDPRVSAVLGVMTPYALGETVNEDKTKQWKKDGFRVSLRDIPGSTEKKEFRVPYSNIEEARQPNLLKEISKLYAPLILIAGELDDVIPPHDVRMIFDKANEPKKLVIVKNIDHDYRLNTEDIKKVNTEIISWLKTQIL